MKKPERDPDTEAVAKAMWENTPEGRVLTWDEAVERDLAGVHVLRRLVKRNLDKTRKS